MITSQSVWAQLNDLAQNNVFNVTGSGAPTNGTSGTGVNICGPGSRYTDNSTGDIYLNVGTLSSPTWIPIAGISALGISQFTTVSLTAAQITTLNSVPITILPAPGAGKAIIFEGMFFSFTYGSVQFTGGGVITLQYHGASTNLMSSSIAASTIQAAANAYLQFIPAATASGIVVSANAGIDIIAATADFAAGNSTAKLFIRTRVITL